MDRGELESIMDAFKSDLKFCQSFEDQLRPLGIKIPKVAQPPSIINLGANLTSESHVGSFLNQSSDIAHQTSGVVLNSIYSVPNLVKNLQKLV